MVRTMNLRPSPGETTSHREGGSLPFALRALFVVVALIIGFAYVICAWQVFGFAENVWRLPLLLCFGAAFVADLLSLAGLFATYLLRQAPKVIQAYAWLVFLGMAGLSIAAAESFASWRFAPEGDKPHVEMDARVASAAIVVALAAAVHLLIICRNHMSDRRARTSEPPAQPPIEAPAEEEPTPTPPRQKVAPPKVQLPKRQVRVSRRGRKADPEAAAAHAAYARRSIAGEPTKDLAAEAGVSTKTIQNWVKEFRANEPELTPEQPADLHAFPLPESPNEPVNGHVPNLNGGVKS
jgi:hypothetical protein